MTASRDMVHDLADYAATLGYDAMTEASREKAKQSLLDTLGVSLAASGLEPAARGVYEIVRECGGAPDCTLLGFGGKAPAIMAALANGALVHCLDYDDLTPWGQHTGSTIVPAVFAVAERQGGVSGKDIIAAVSLGQDIFARLRCNVVWKKDWNLSTVLAVFAGTAAACRVMGMSAPRTAAALGIAANQSAGVMETVASRGSNLKGLYAGFSAKSAVLAALMAEKGILGIDRALEGTYGFFNSYFDGKYDRAAILDGLGQPEANLGAATLYKRWPCVGTAHSHIKATLDIMAANGLSAADVAEFRLHVGPYHDLMSQPLEERRAPATLADAKFSLPFLVGLAAVRGGISLTDFTADGLRDPEVLAAARKISLVQDPSRDWKMELPSGRVEIVAKDGQSWAMEGLNVPGSPENPMGWDDIAAKFRECASLSATPIAADKVEHAIELARSLDEHPDATALIRSLG